MEFVLLAIKANQDFAYLKNLRPHVLYQFTNDYEFVGYVEGSGTFRNITAIKDKESFPKEVYDVKLANRKPLNVNIAAVLGKNGAGKSSLLELIYLLVYCISERKWFIRDRIFSQRHIDLGYTKEYFEEYKAEINRLLKNAKLELYYRRKDIYYMITNTGEQIILYQLTAKGWKVAKFEPQLFFYSVCVNYSLYGLNSSGGYGWLNPLFHKNDGYQTPIVLNPFRERGVININTEIHLAQTRLLTNLTDRNFTAGKIIDNKEIAFLTFDIFPDNIGKIDGYELSKLYQLTADEKKVNLFEVFVSLVKRYHYSIPIDFNAFQKRLEADLEPRKKTTDDLFNEKYHQDEIVGYHIIADLLVKYIITKIVKICMRYDEYKDFTEVYSNTKAKIGPVKLINQQDKLVTRLLNDDSHITLKLKQALNAFIHRYFSGKEWHKIRNIEQSDKFIYRCQVNIEELRTLVNDAFSKSEMKKKRITHFIPTAFFKPNINLSFPGGNSEFTQLSSGEQQLIHSVHSIIYHLLNIDTLDRKDVSYSAVNLILDEIELYYHPDYQRLFIQRLLEDLSRLHLTRVKGLNIIFSTHSPFILSDIPHFNVVKMLSGKQVPFDPDEKTFGSNIHEMLTDSFFLDSELIGEFAKKKIENCILQLNDIYKLKEQHQKEISQKIPLQITGQTSHIDSEKIKPSAFTKARHQEEKTRLLYNTIQMIGEPVVRFKLMEMYDEIGLAGGDEKEKVKRQIQQLMNTYQIDRNEI
ncbi:MAG: AAA family ATPase [Mucilaginibacter sp.]